MQGRGHQEGWVGKRSQLVGNVREYGKGYAEGGVGQRRGKNQTPIWFGLYNICNGRNGLI